MTEPGDFIHIADIGKLIETTGTIRGYYEKRANKSGKRLSEVPDERDSLDVSIMSQKPTEMRTFAAANGMSELSLNVLNSLIYEAANEHPEINQLLRDVFTRIAMFCGPEVDDRKTYLRNQVTAANGNRERIIKTNKSIMENAVTQSRDFAKRIAEAEDVLLARKNKLIRSIDKAWTVAGSADKLSQSDRTVFKYLKKIEWIDYSDDVISIRADYIIEAEFNYCNEVFKYIKDLIIDAKRR